MRWSWKLGRVFGINVQIHATFLILLAWVAISGYLQAPASGLIYVVAVFGIVVLHELGHALAARRYGIGTRDITLLPIGGVARLDRMPDEPRQELLVAIAGPAVNVALAGVLGFIAALGASPLDAAGLTSGGLLARLFWTNVSLAIFNLLPAFPMDGGRVLRAALAMRMGLGRATFIAARTGQGMALLLGAFGLFFNPILLLIALFVWTGAAQELAAVQLREAFGGMGHPGEPEVEVLSSWPSSPRRPGREAWSGWSAIPRGRRVPLAGLVTVDGVVVVAPARRATPRVVLWWRR